MTNGQVNFSKEIKLDAIILSAGKSGRIGMPKALLQYKGKTFIQQIIENLFEVCKEIVVVLGYDPEPIKNKIDELKLSKPVKFAINENYELGMFSSIQCGLREISSNCFVLIQQVDQPDLSLQFYKDFKSQIEKDVDWLQPSFQNLPGHPIIISNYIKTLIINEIPIMNLRDLKRKYKFKTKIWDCSYPQIHTDIDTLDDLNKFLQETK